jgi:hypothetical protein
MRKWLVFGVVLLVVGCGQSSAVIPTVDKDATTPAAEAKFKGKTVSQWARGLSDKDAATRTEAAEALKAIGPDAKSAVGELKQALKHRCMELLISHLGFSSNRTFTYVSNTIASTGGGMPSKDDVIADLRRQLENKNRQIADHHKQQDDLANDPCLKALVNALVTIDRRELEALAPAPEVQARKTFTNVKLNTAVGSSSGK